MITLKVDEPLTCRCGCGTPVQPTKWSPVRPYAPSHSQRSSKQTIAALPVRFWAKVRVDLQTGCWEWQGALSYGYGSFGVSNGMQRGAHRVAYEALVGPVPEDRPMLDHLCRNTRCCNPEHLEPVTHAENMARSIRAMQTHCLNGHEFTEANTYRAKNGTRSCRTCARDAERARRRRVPDCAAHNAEDSGAGIIGCCAEPEATADPVGTAATPVRTVPAGTICAVDGCDRRRVGTRDYCNRHYRRMLRYGDPRKLAQKTLRERLLSRLAIDPDTGCLVYTGNLTSSGYGSIGDGGRVFSTHRVMWEMFVGPIPDGLQLDHLCRNRACANVAHLEPVTQAENGRRGLKGVLYTHCANGHLLDDANTFRRSGDGGRRCRICRRAHVRAYMARVKASGDPVRRRGTR